MDDNCKSCTEMPTAQSKRRTSLKNFALLALPLVLASFFISTHPFRVELVSRIFSLASLSPSQQFNIALAAHTLDNLVLRPGDEFSFNKVLGPRSDSKGYRAAPSYVGQGSPATVGGGICLVSSALYQAALATGMTIEERSPHMRTISSVPPGLDATVWYGRSDLKFKNTTGHPIQIKAECKNHNLYIRFLGEQGKEQAKVAELKTFVSRQNKNELLVEVFRQSANSRDFVSRDHYQISR